MKKKIVLIGNAHLDPVWLWRWQEGFSEIKATFRSALDRMNENPDFVFTCAGASYYKWVEENCPEMFEEIRRRVAEGRWVVVGGMWIQPDCNLPSGESFARQCLYSQRYYQEKLGVTSKTGYNVDSFGHNLMLPQILSKSGMNAYVFMRPGRYENDIKHCLFRWQSPDASEVTAYRIPLTYANGDLRKDGLREFIGNVVRDVQIDQDIDVMTFYGVGNHGGGPTARQIDALGEIIAEDGEFDISFGSPDSYFKSIASQTLSLPVWRDDLQHHASGCYAAVSERKALNRKAENRLISAEAAGVMANMLMAMPYRNDLYNRAWDNIMFNHFHDIMGGCSIREAYDDSREFDGESLAIAAKLQNASAQRISWAINTMGDVPFTVTKENDWSKWEVENRGTPIVVFNPLPYPVKNQIHILQKAGGISDENGNYQPHQIVRASRSNNSDKWDTVFDVEVPAYGYRVYRTYGTAKHNADAPAGLAVTDTCIENSHIKAVFERGTGYMTSLVDKATGRNLLRGCGMIPIVIDDYKQDTWSHGVFVFDRETGCFNDAVTEVRENGALRSCLRVTSFYGKSKLILDYYLRHDSSELEVKVTVDWREEFKILKLAFPLDAENIEVTYEIPFGWIKRPLNGEEEPGLSWVDITGDNSGIKQGITLINDAKYSYSAANGEVRLCAARSGVYADHYAAQSNERDETTILYDVGIQQFNLIVAPHIGALDASQSTRRAQILNNPLFYVQETYHQGTLPEYSTGIEITSPSIVVTALKQSEDGFGYVLRAYDASGSPNKCKFILPYIGAKFVLDFTAHEIKTVYIDKLSKNVEERMITEYCIGT